MDDQERTKPADDRTEERAAPHETVKDTVPGSDISHPAGTVLGGTAGAAAGGTLGALAGGPIGAVIGAAIGGAAGAYGGRVAGENLNPEDEDAYWRENYYKLDYVTPEDRYEDYAPAYRFGREAHRSYPDRSFEDAEILLERDWEVVKGDSRLSWERAKRAVRDAWERG
jgi:predicted lipid-binding transport protein (Tim44 family)